MILKKRKIEKGHNLVIEYGNWLNTYEWTFYCTFTTRYSQSQSSARRAMERLYNNLNRRFPKMRIFWCTEPFDLKEGCHNHALIYLPYFGTNGLEKCKSKVLYAWQVVTKANLDLKCAFTHILPYDKNAGGNFYSAKQSNRKNSDYDMFGF